MTTADGGLLRRFREGEAAIPAFLDDYAFFTQALLDLYEADFDARRLELALAADPSNEAVVRGPRTRRLLQHRGRRARPCPAVKDEYDGAEPSGNSIMVHNLLRLSQIAGAPELRESAACTLRAFAGRLRGMPAAAPQMLAGRCRTSSRLHARSSSAGRRPDGRNARAAPRGKPPLSAGDRLAARRRRFAGPSRRLEPSARRDAPHNGRPAPTCAGFRVPVAGNRSGDAAELLQ